MRGFAGRISWENDRLPLLRSSALLSPSLLTRRRPTLVSYLPEDQDVCISGFVMISLSAIRKTNLALGLVGQAIEPVRA
jgi:hypothetical protein